MKKKQEEKKKHGDQNFYQGWDEESKAEKILKGLLSDLSNVLESSGFLEPIHKVYVLAKDLDFMSPNTFLFTLTTAANLKFWYEC